MEPLFREERRLTLSTWYEISDKNTTSGPIRHSNVRFRSMNGMGGDVVRRDSIRMACSTSQRLKRTALRVLVPAPDRSRYCGAVSPAIGEGGPHTTKPGSARTFRGSKKRLARIRMRDNFSIEFWCFVALMAFLLLVGIPWMLKHPDGFHHHHGRTTDSSGTSADSTHAP